MQAPFPYIRNIERPLGILRFLFLFTFTISTVFIIKNEPLYLCITLPFLAAISFMSPNGLVIDGGEVRIERYYLTGFIKRTISFKRGRFTVGPYSSDKVQYEQDWVDWNGFTWVEFIYPKQEYNWVVLSKKDEKGRERGYKLFLGPDELAMIKALEDFMGNDELTEKILIAWRDEP